eukprot:3968401-Pleurochrysis_carterae.AAC.1
MSVYERLALTICNCNRAFHESGLCGVRVRATIPGLAPSLVAYVRVSSPPCQVAARPATRCFRLRHAAVAARDGCSWTVYLPGQVSRSDLGVDDHLACVFAKSAIASATISRLFFGLARLGCVFVEQVSKTVSRYTSRACGSIKAATRKCRTSFNAN